MNMCSRSFGVKLGQHQGSVLSSLLFSIVMDVVTKEARSGLPRELQYAVDHILMATTEDELRKKFVGQRIEGETQEDKVDGWSVED